MDLLEAAGVKSLDGVVEKYIKQNASSVKVYKFLIKHTKAKDCYDGQIKAMMQKSANPIVNAVMSKFVTKCPKLIGFIEATRNMRHMYDHSFPVRYAVQYDVMEPHRKKMQYAE